MLFMKQTEKKITGCEKSRAKQVEKTQHILQGMGFDALISEAEFPPLLYIDRAGGPSSVGCITT